MHDTAVRRDKPPPPLDAQRLVECLTFRPKGRDVGRQEELFAGRPAPAGRVVVTQRYQSRVIESPEVEICREHAIDEIDQITGRLQARKVHKETGVTLHDKSRQSDLSLLKVGKVADGAFRIVWHAAVSSRSISGAAGEPRPASTRGRPAAPSIQVYGNNTVTPGQRSGPELRGKATSPELRLPLEPLPFAYNSVPETAGGNSMCFG